MDTTSDSRARVRVSDVSSPLVDRPSVIKPRTPLRKTVKAILLQQDPPYHKNDGGLGSIAPILSGVKTDSFNSSASFVQTEY